MKNDDQARTPTDKALRECINCGHHGVTGWNGQELVEAMAYELLRLRMKLRYGSSSGDGKTVADLAETIDSTPWPELTGDEDASAFVERIEKEREEPPSAQVIDLMEALKASLAASGKR